MSWFKDLLSVFRVFAMCFGRFSQQFWDYLQQVLAWSPGRGTSNFKCGCYWFLGLFGAVLRVVVTSDL